MVFIDLHTYFKVYSEFITNMFYWSLNIFWTSLTVYLTLFVKPETIIMMPKIDWTQNIKLIFKIENLVLAKTIPSLDSSSLVSIRFPKRLESADNTLTTGFIGELILNSKNVNAWKINCFWNTVKLVYNKLQGTGQIWSL